METCRSQYTCLPISKYFYIHPFTSLRMCAFSPISSFPTPMPVPFLRFGTINDLISYFLFSLLSSFESSSSNRGGGEIILFLRLGLQAYFSLPLTAQPGKESPPLLPSWFSPHIPYSGAGLSSVPSAQQALADTSTPLQTGISFLVLQKEFHHG